MSVAISSSERGEAENRASILIGSCPGAPALVPAPVPAPAMQRSEGRAVIAFKRRGPATVLDRLRQEGCAKIRLPRDHGAGGPVAVLLNTAGGLTGGDRFDVHGIWAPDTTATLTTQAAERLYRSSGGTARVANRLEVGKGATAFWLPQETIVFDGSMLERRFDVALAGDARLVAVESWVIGRRAMGEQVRSGGIVDHWRIRIDGRLVLADTLRLSGDMHATLQRPTIARGRTCFATLLLAGSASGEATACLNGLRNLVACSRMDGLLVARLLAADAAELRTGLVAAIRRLGEILPGADLRVPKVWSG